MKNDGTSRRGALVELSDLPLVVYGLLLLAYLFTRSASVSFSWDEAYTYLHHVQHGILWPERFDEMGANLHLLNVWLMWIADNLLGSHEWMLRLPNVLAGALYLGLSFLLVRSVRPWPVALALYVLLTAHPYMLDMFSLARGYGVGIAFMLLSLVHMRKYATTPSIRAGVLAMVGAGLASLSNLIFLNFLFAALATMAVLLLCEPVQGKAKWKKTALILLTPVPIIGATAFLAYQLNAGGSLYFGSADLPEAIRSVAIKVFYHLPDYAEPVVLFKWALGVTLALPAAIFLIGLVRGVRAVWYPMFPGMLVLTFWSIGMSVEHALFGTPWPHARTGIWVIPSAGFFFVTAWLNPFPGVRVLKWAACILAIPILQLQSRALNLTYCIEWKASGEVRNMVERLRSTAGSNRPGGDAITVCSGFESRMPLFYYRSLYRMHGLSITLLDPEGAIPRSDFYLVEYNAMHRIDTVHWELDYWSEPTNAKLFRDRRNFGGNWRPEATERAALDDGSWAGDVHLFGEQRFGGAIKYEFNERTAGLPWIVVSVPVISGHQNDWISMDVLIKRNGRMLESRSVRTSGDVYLASSDMLKIAFIPSQEILAGDSLHGALWAATGVREQYAGRAVLVVFVKTLDLR